MDQRNRSRRAPVFEQRELAPRPDRLATWLNLSAKQEERIQPRLRATARLGLSTVHNSPRLGDCTLTTAQGGACTKLRRRYVTPRPNPYQAPRGLIHEFSRRSRTRLQQSICAMPIRHVQRGVLFATLTYPANYPGEWTEWKRHLDTWLKRMARRFPRAAGFWKLEPQQRGAPHFHLLIVGVGFIAREWLSRSWYEVVGSGDPKHLEAGTNIQLAFSHRGVVSYAAKYTAKTEHLPPDWQDGVGRWWGVYNREGLGTEYAWVWLSQPQFFAATRVLRHLIDRRQKAVGRAPPRASPGGMWAVLREEQAARIVSWLNA